MPAVRLPAGPPTTRCKTGAAAPPQLSSSRGHIWRRTQACASPVGASGQFPLQGAADAPPAVHVPQRQPGTAPRR
eukprot:15090858-Alexandrium_andersonii.AAC.1